MFIRFVCRISFVGFWLIISSGLNAQVEWEKYENNPVLDVGAPGSWDQSGVDHHSIYYDGTTYHMWYAGNDGVNKRIGYAFSSDGIVWTKHSDNPVLDIGASGEWDERMVTCPTVVFDGTSFKMWYLGINSSFSRLVTGYATSPDGINWTKYANNPVLVEGPSGSWDQALAIVGSVLFDGSSYKMWYSGAASFGAARIGYATSSDGINWTKLATNPIMGAGPSGSWDDVTANSPNVVFDGTSYHMWYRGRDGATNRIGYATSPDGLDWTKHADNPVLDIGPSGTWESNNLGQPRAIFDGTNYKMWYFGVNAQSQARIGYATSTPPQPSVSFTKITTGPIANDGGFSQGSSWGDYDGDGDEDLIITNGSINNALNTNFFYRNDGNGVLTRLNESLLDTLTGSFATVSFGDYDNDGDLDAFVPANGVTADYDNTNRLYNNDGTGKFNLVNSDALLNDGGDTIGSSWVDVDNDGDLDLFVANNNDQKNFLYRNNGPDSSYSFTKIATGSIVNDLNNSLSGTWADYDNDGDLDLFTANVLQNDRLYLNIGNGEFTQLSGDPIVNQAEFGISGSWGDYDNDGDLDLFTPIFGGVDRLYQNNGDGSFQEIVPGPFGVNPTQTGPGTWGDFDNDGDLDLFVCNTDGNNFLYRNDGVNGFASIEAGDITIDNGYTSSANDFDMDGDLDILIVRGGFLPPVFDNNLYLNEGNDYNWIQIKCEGTVSNRSAIGARIHVKAMIDTSPVWQMREIAQQSNFSTNNGFIQHFGLGSASNVDSLKIEWPSGIIQTGENIAVNQLLTVIEDTVITGIDDKPRNAPSQIALAQNYPNPFNPETVINYQLSISTRVELSIYDLLGKKVRTLVDEHQTAGERSVKWDGKNSRGVTASSGIYIYRLKAGGQVVSRKMLLMK